MKSMTGFGRGTAVAGPWHAAVEAAATNRKQAEVVVQAPREVQELETRVRQAVLAVLSRGRAQVSINIERAMGGEADGLVNESQARAFERAFVELSRVVGRDVEPTAADFLRQPGILQLGLGAIDPEEVWRAVEPALAAALAALNAMREAEGGHLRDDLAARVGALRHLAGEIARDAPDRPARQREVLLRRLREADLDLDPADERVMREIAVFADRCDISEELTRLESHFAKFGDYLDSPDATGRALDFLCQELIREFNTIGSKANDAAIAQFVVEAKTEVEKIREQVQNVE